MCTLTARSLLNAVYDVIRRKRKLQESRCNWIQFLEYSGPIYLISIATQRSRNAYLLTACRPAPSGQFDNFIVAVVTIFQTGTQPQRTFSLSLPLQPCRLGHAAR